MSKGAHNGPPTARVLETLSRLLTPRGFRCVETRAGGMGGWFTRWESTDFITTASRDRAGETIGIEVGAKIRPKPKAPLRSHWLSAVRGFLEGGKDHASFASLDEELLWLEERIDDLLDPDLLNSEELRSWKVRASRRLFGQA